jgi:hypothetical protein
MKTAEATNLGRFRSSLSDYLSLSRFFSGFGCAGGLGAGFTAGFG